MRLANGIVTELSATARAGIARFTYTSKDKGFFSIDAKLNGNSDSGSTKVTANNVALALASDGKSMSGQAVAPAFCTPYGTVWNAPVYFYATFDAAQAGHLGGEYRQQRAATLQFDLTDADRTVTVKVGVSSVSVRNAQANLKAEGETLAFDDARKNASGPGTTASTRSRSTIGRDARSVECDAEGEPDEVLHRALSRVRHANALQRHERRIPQHAPAQERGWQLSEVGRPDRHHPGACDGEGQ